MNINFLSKAIAPLAALAALSMAAPASAAVFFGNGDTLNITGDYQSSVTPGKYEFITADDDVAALGEYGNFRVSSRTSTGAFAPFGGRSVEDGYKILSVNFNDATTYLNKLFLVLSKGADGFTFEITKPVVASAPETNGGLTTEKFSYQGIFKSLDDQTLGKGVLTGNFAGINGSYSATLIVTETQSVPEPSALLGIGLMVGAVYVIRRRQVAIA